MHFFEHLANCFRRDRIDKPQFNGFACKQAQGPVVRAIGGRGAGDGSQVGRLFTCQCLALAQLPFVMQDGLQSSVQAHPPYFNSRIAADAERFAELGIGPAIGGFEQGMCLCEGSSISFSCMDERLEERTIFCGQTDRERMLHVL